MNQTVLRRQRGMTLIEVMIVIAIIGILATIAGWWSSEWTRKRRFSELARETFHALNQARMGALAKGRPGVVTFGASRVTAFVDFSSPANHVFDLGTDQLLQIFPEPPEVYATGIVFSSTFPQVGGVYTAIFNPEGFSTDVAGTMLGGEVVFTDAVLGGRTMRVETTSGGASRIR